MIIDWLKVAECGNCHRDILEDIFLLVANGIHPEKRGTSWKSSFVWSKSFFGRQCNQWMVCSVGL